ncbi:hypothetical protein CFP56_013060, partial [Quercus suber]
TAIWLLGKDKGLAKGLETNNLTRLHLLAKMPSAFGSSSHIVILKKILRYWLPSQREDKDSDDDDDADNGCDHKNFSRKHALTPRLAELLVKADSTWAETHKDKVEDKTISLGDIDGGVKLNKGKEKADSTWAETHKDKVEDKTISLGDIDGGVKLNKGKEKVSLTIEVAGDGREIKYRYTPNEIRTPLLTAASEGIVEIFDKIIEGTLRQLSTLIKMRKTYCMCRCSPTERNL